MRENYKKVKGYKSVFKYIWNKDSKNKFIKVFDSEDIKTKIKNLLSTDICIMLIWPCLIFKTYLYIFAADKSLKKIKCRTSKSVYFTFDNQCIQLKKEFKNKMNAFKKDFHTTKTYKYAH